MNNIIDVCGRKCFAVYILAHVWSGGKMPKAMIAEAKRIRAQMKSEGTWESA